MAVVRLRIYSRAGCHLCDEMKQVVFAVAADYGGVVEEIDISEDAALEAEFGAEVPVLFVNDRKAFKYRVTPPELRRRLQRESRPRRSWWS
jgi:hypothetical protein